MVDDRVKVQNVLDEVSRTGPILGFIFLNKPPVDRNTLVESKVALFLNVAELSSVAGLGLGLLLAARRGKLSPITRAWGLGLGTVAGFPARLALESRYPLKQVDLVSADRELTDRHRRTMLAGAVCGALFPLFGGSVLGGLQLGLGAWRVGEELGLGTFVL